MEKLALLKKGVNNKHIDSAGRGLADNYYLWNNGATLKVKFLSGSKVLQNKVKAAANEWMRFGNIKFQYVTSGPADFRVFLGKGNGHNSYVGTVCGMIDPDQETMNLDTADLTNDISLKGTVMHEFGHALGLLHEHSSPISGIKWNKEKIYKVYEESYGWSKDDVDFQVFEVYKTFYTNGTQYDPKSIMHYSIEPWETLNGYSVPWNNYMSPGDKELIAALYPKTGTRKNEVPRVTIANFQKLSIKDNKAKGGLSIYPTFDMVAAGKAGKVYLLVEFFDENGDAIIDSDGLYSFDEQVSAISSLTTIPGKKISYNKVKNDLEIFIPYEQMELTESQDIYARFRVILQTPEGEIKDLYYGKAASFSYSK